MSFSEHDRGILREMLHVQYEIRDALLETKDLNIRAFNLSIDRTNKQARITQELLHHHIEVLEEANEVE